MYLGYYLHFYLLYMQAKIWDYPFMSKFTIVIIGLIATVVILSKLINHYEQKAFIKKNRSLKNFKTVLESSLDDMLFSKATFTEQHVLSAFDSFNEFKGNRRGLKMLSKYLIQANLKAKHGELGLNDTNYMQILNTYDVLKFWEQELGSNNLGRIHRAKQNLDDLKKEYQGQIQQLSEKDNTADKAEVIQHSQFDPTVPYKFLDDSFCNDFNALDEILVHRFLVAKFDSGKLPLLSRWVRNSNNTAFKLFMIKEIAFFNQKGCASILAAQLIKESNNDIRLAIIEALVEMQYGQSETQIIACYKLGDNRVKKSIIKAITSFKSRFGLEYLNELFFETADHELRQDLLAAMKNIRGDKGHLDESHNFSSSVQFKPFGYNQMNYQLG